MKHLTKTSTTCYSYYNYQRYYDDRLPENRGY
jgi:hypothetical protein